MINQHRRHHHHPEMRHTVLLWLSAIFVLGAGSMRWYLKFHPYESWPVAYRYVTITNYVKAQAPEDDAWKIKDKDANDYGVIRRQGMPVYVPNTVSTTMYVTNLYATNSIKAEFPNRTIFATNIYVTNTYVTNLWTTGR